MARTSGILVSFLFLLLPLFASGQYIVAIDKALRSGDAATLSQYFAPRVEISLPDSDGIHNAQKATFLLNEFFEKVSVQDYKRAHLSTPQDNRPSYSIGDLVTASGKYRLTLFFNAESKITEIKAQAN